MKVISSETNKMADEMRNVSSKNAQYRLNQSKNPLHQEKHIPT